MKNDSCSRSWRQDVLRFSVIGFFATSFLLGVAECAEPAPAASPPPSIQVTPVPVGVWGGPHILLQVRPDQGAVLKFECAAGTADRSLIMDKDGNFKETGTYNAEAGPVVMGLPRAFRTVYSGNVDGDTMHLTVQHDDAYSRRVSEDFVLVYNEKPDFSEVCPE